MSNWNVRELAGVEMRGLERLARTSPHGGVFCAPSWYDFQRIDYRPVGVYKGEELVAGCCVPTVGGRVPSIVHRTPWSGPVGRTQAEGECLEVSQRLAAYMRGRWGEAALTLPPEWEDVRGFLWEGYRSHVRYTYRGYRPTYEKRLRLHDCFVRLEHVAHGDWHETHYATGDSLVVGIHDWNRVYYWTGNEGGTYHADCVSSMIKDAERDERGFDMVGCNSPGRGLFKRQFGGQLTPYYHVTTGDPAKVLEFWGEKVPLAA